MIFTDQVIHIKLGFHGIFYMFQVSYVYGKAGIFVSDKDILNM